MIKLPVQHLKDSYFQDIKEQLRVIFFEELFRPIVKIIKENSPLPVKVENATTGSLKRALRSGRIQYADGVFSGQFSIPISRDLESLGAVWHKRERTFHLEQMKIPVDVMNAHWDYWYKARVAHDMIETELQAVARRVKESQYEVNAKGMVAKVDAGWRQAAARLAIKPELTEDGKANLSAGYSENMNLWIKKWLEEEIKELRQDVQANAEQGYRFDSLIDRIQHRSGVSRTKATFLARQETSLFMSKFQAERYQAAGSVKYQWSGANDERERPGHKQLNGKVFRWDSPPPAHHFSIGKPCNPGEDYECRCVAIPLL